MSSKTNLSQKRIKMHTVAMSFLIVNWCSLIMWVMRELILLFKLTLAYFMLSKVLDLETILFSAYSSTS